MRRIVSLIRHEMRRKVFTVCISFCEYRKALTLGRLSVSHFQRLQSITRQRDPRYPRHSGEVAARLPRWIIPGAVVSRGVALATRAVVNECLLFQGQSGDDIRQDRRPEAAVGSSNNPEILVRNRTANVNKWHCQYSPE